MWQGTSETKPILLFVLSKNPIMYTNSSSRIIQMCDNFFTIIYIVNDAKEWINDRHLYNNNSSSMPREPQQPSMPFSKETQFTVSINPISQFL